MLDFLQQFTEIDNLRYIPNKLGTFPLNLTIYIEETNLCYKPDRQSAKFMELCTVDDGKRHLLYSDIKSELDMTEVIYRIRTAQEYIILKYVA
jgi:hypothetical protein